MLSKKAVNLLRRVKAHIIEEPRRLAMESWVQVSSEAPCGTAACIAGWACLLTLPKTEYAKYMESLPDPNNNDFDHYWMRSRKAERIAGRGKKPMNRAMDLLGLKRDAAMELFLDENWPERLSNRFNEAQTAKTQAKIAGQAIDAFIKQHTKGDPQ